MTSSDALLDLRPRIADALRQRRPVVALESTVITHGLPRPVNLELARGCEAVVRDGGAEPATVGVSNGRVAVGLEDAEIAELANAEGVVKTNLSNLAPALVGRRYGATSVSTTLYAARRAGIQVAATGGIGGVHRGYDTILDISSDLTALARLGGVLVCAGAKAILDVPATRELLETLGVPVLGWRTDFFPLFYSSGSSIAVDQRVESGVEVAEHLRMQAALGLEATILVVADPPAQDAVPREALEVAIGKALRDAEDEGVSSRAVTPYLLGRVKDLTQGQSLRANLALLRNNCAIAAEIARALI